MSWTNELFNIYVKNCGKTENGEPLLPVAHSSVNAQIEITLKEDGEFVNARKVDKTEAITVIPVTGDSGSRTSGIFPHPFNDKLIYIAGDYKTFAPDKYDNEKYFEAYLKGLEDWKNSANSHPALTAVYEYLNKKCIITNLVKCGVFDPTDEKAKIAGIAQEAAFVRFRIAYKDTSKESRTWQDTDLYECYIAYNSSVMTKKQLCYATGEILPCIYKHPSKIRNSGDKAKLISTNDENGFAYRGRFDNKEQAISVSYDFSQKMHNALKWLIARQGLSIGSSLVYLAWESSLKPLPSTTDSFWGGFDDDDDDFSEKNNKDKTANTFPAYQVLLSKSIFGYKSLLENNSKAMILMLDSATTGRLSISMYSELSSSELLDNIERWHLNTAWKRFNGKLKKTIISSFNLYEIINSALGTEKGKFLDVGPKLMRETIVRLIPCVTEGRRLPKDIIRGLVSKASNPLSYENDYNFRTVLEAACGMIRKSIIEQKGECNMALDLNNCDRSYLFGRLLAAADAAENSTYDNESKRTTNAKRYWSAFSARPYQTWKIIEERLRPYIDKSEITGVWYSKLFNEIMDKMSFEDFTSKDKLQPSYLLGYHCQLSEIYSGKKKDSDVDSDSEADEAIENT